MVAPMSPETAQAGVVPVPHQSRPPSCAKSSPCTQALWQQTQAWVKAARSLPGCGHGDHHEHPGCAADPRPCRGSGHLGLHFGSSKVILRSCSSAPSCLALLRCCEMKFGAAPFCFQLVERKPGGWKPNKAKANKAFSMNIFTSSEGAEGSISCIPDDGVPSSTDNYGVGAS